MISTWNESVLHRIVDSFLKVRFPMMLVLNKADTDTASAIIERFVLNIIILHRFFKV